MIGLLLATLLSVPAGASSPSAPESVSQSAEFALSVGQPAPVPCVCMTYQRSVRVAELAIIGKKAESGAFAVPFWKTAAILALNATLVGLETYRLAHKK